VSQGKGAESSGKCVGGKGRLGIEEKRSIGKDRTPKRLLHQSRDYLPVAEARQARIRELVRLFKRTASTRLE